MFGSPPALRTRLRRQLAEAQVEQLRSFALAQRLAARASKVNGPVVPVGRAELAHLLQTASHEAQLICLLSQLLVELEPEANPTGGALPTNRD